MESTSSPSTQLHINQLPEKILGRILELAIEKRRAKLIDAHVGCQPLNFLQVCRHWRRVAKSTPTLWDSLWTPAYESTERPFQQELQTTLNILSCCLEWSKPRPLRLAHATLAHPDMGLSDRDFHEWAEESLRVLAQHEARWHSLDIVFDEYLLDQFSTHFLDTASVLSILGVNLRALKFSLGSEFAFESEDHPSQIAAVFGWVSMLPRLEDLDLILSNADGLMEHIRILQLENLKKFRFEHLCATLEEILEIIPRCKNARSVIVEMTSYIHDMEFEGPPPIPTSDLYLGYSLPCLTHLTLDRAPCPFELLRYLFLPVLEVLKVRCGVAETDTRIEVLQDFFARSQCELRILQIYDDELSADDILQIYALPNLHPALEVAFAEIQGPIGELVEHATRFSGIHALPFAVWKEVIWSDDLGYKEEAVKDSNAMDTDEDDDDDDDTMNEDAMNEDAMNEDVIEAIIAQDLNMQTLPQMVGKPRVRYWFGRLLPRPKEDWKGWTQLLAYDGTQGLSVHQPLGEIFS